MLEGMIRGEFWGIGNGGKTMGIDRPLLMKTVSPIESALQRIVFGDRSIRVNHNNAKIGCSQPFFRPRAAQYQFDHVIKQPNRNRSRVGEVDIQEPGEPPPVLRRLERGFAVWQLRMIPVAIQEIHARGAQFLEVSIYLSRVGCRVNYSQKARIQKISIAMLSQSCDSFQNLVVSSLTGVVDSMAIMNSSRPVNTHPQRSLKLGADIKDCFRYQHTVGLDTDRVCSR